MVIVRSKDEGESYLGAAGRDRAVFLRLRQASVRVRLNDGLGFYLFKRR